jgi:hypothetical protein
MLGTLGCKLPFTGYIYNTVCVSIIINSLAGLLALGRNLYLFPSQFLVKDLDSRIKTVMQLFKVKPNCCTLRMVFSDGSITTEREVPIYTQ